MLRTWCGTGSAAARSRARWLRLRMPIGSSTGPGFTTIELVIAMILLLVAFGIATRFVVDGFGSERRTRDTHTLIVSLHNASDLIASDVRMARSPDRSIATMSRLLRLRSVIRGRATDPSLDLRDIVRATPNELWLRADAISEPVGTTPVAECVGYVVDDSGALLRIIGGDWRVCPTGAGESERLVAGPPTGPPPAPFSYTVMSSPLTDGTCDLVPGTKGSDDDASTVLMRITAVSVDMTAYLNSHGVAATSDARTAMDIRTRLDRDYLFALGCSR